MINAKTINKSSNIFIYNNRFIITWMLHQIFMYSDKMMLTAGKNEDTSFLHALLFTWMNEQTNKLGPYEQHNLTTNFPL